MHSSIGFSGEVKVRHITAHGPGLLWKVRNLPNVVPGLARHAIAKVLRMNHMLGTLRLQLFRADGDVVDYGLVSTRLVTTAFCEFMVDQLIAETSVWGDFKFHDSGVGTTPAAIGDTDIETTDAEARATGTQVEGSSVIYRSVGTIAYTTGLAITEHGLFSVVTGGTMMDHHIFAAVNVVNGDSIQFTFDLSVTAGG